MSDATLNKSPVSVGTGGMLYAILKGLTGSAKDLSAFTISPLIFIFSLPCAVLFPMLWALFIYKSHCIKTHKHFSLKEFVSKHKVYLLCCEIFYAACCYILLSLLFYKLDSLTASYILQAQHLNMIQVGTPVQADYARSVTYVFSIAAFFGLLLISFLSLVTYALVNAAEPIVRSALKGFILNFPGYIAVYAACICVFIVLERAFAVFKLNVVQSVVLNQDYIDWSWGFIALRIYLLCAFVNAVFVLGSLIFRHMSLPEKNVQ